MRNRIIIFLDLMLTLILSILIINNILQNSIYSFQRPNKDLLLGGVLPHHFSFNFPSYSLARAFMAAFISPIKFLFALKHRFLHLLIRVLPFRSMISMVVFTEPIQAARGSQSLLLLDAYTCEKCFKITLKQHPNSVNH